jgi:transcriptional regulator NrdR family protein
MRLDDEDRKRITASDVPRGLVCPHCGCSHFWTTHTRYPELGVIKRHKTCRMCGERIVSYEKIRKEC